MNESRTNANAESSASSAAPEHETELRARVRRALVAQDELAPPPAFMHVYAAARRRVAAAGAATRARRPAFAYLAVAAGVASVAIALFVARPFGPRDARDEVQSAGVREVGTDANVPPDDARRGDADYAAALALRRSVRGGTPLDPLLASLPATVSRGLPALPEYRYPLLPEDAPLGAAATTRNPS